MDADRVKPPPPTGAAPRDGRFRVLHAAVPGRLRVAIDGLRRRPDRVHRLVDEVGAAAPGLRASASAWTGTVLLTHAAALPRDAVLDALGRAWRRAMARVPAQAAATVPAGVPAAAWSVAVKAILADLDVDPEAGLSQGEATARRARFGSNRLDVALESGWLGALGDQLLTVPMALLGASAGLSAVTGNRLDAAAIGAVVALNTAIGLATEQGAERAIAELQRASSPRCRARRNGADAALDPGDLVPGDVLVLERGGFVGADARLVASDDLTVAEAALTGESGGVAKTAAAMLPLETPLGDRRNMVFAGTAVMGGSGLAVVTTTGARTEMGVVQRLVASSRPPPTPLQVELDGLGRRLAVVFAALCALVFVLGVARGQGVLAMLRLAASIAVAAVPEGLPTVATTTLALGVNKMRREGILVRRLAAVEALGQTRTICFDKTGTLTRNRMELAAIDVGAGREVPRAEDRRHLRLLETAALATEARFEARADGLRIDGSGTEQALLQGAITLGVDVAALFREHPRQGFSGRSERTPFVVSVHGGGEGPRLAVKGSPEALLARASHLAADGGAEPLSRAAKAALQATNEAMGRAGLRVLAVAVADDVAAFS